MVEKLSNAQVVNIFSSSNVSFYTISSHVLDSDSENVCFFYVLIFFKPHQQSPFKGLFFQIFFEGGACPQTP